ncbi:hypothetical protein GCM10009865_44120 [Aeromicrobium ponti]
MIYNASDYSKERGRKLFYTDCTRAMHRLSLFTLGETCPFIGELDEGCYKFVDIG